MQAATPLVHDACVRPCVCVTVHHCVGECSLSNGVSLQHMGEGSTDVARRASMTRSPPVRFSAEQCAWTCLRRCEAKHHRFVFRQHIPRGRLPSCTCKRVYGRVFVKCDKLACVTSEVLASVLINTIKFCLKNPHNNMH